MCIALTDRVRYYWWELKQLGISVYSEENNIDTAKTDGEMLVTIFGMSDWGSAGAWKMAPMCVILPPAVTYTRTGNIYSCEKRAQNRGKGCNYRHNVV